MEKEQNQTKIIDESNQLQNQEVIENLDTQPETNFVQQPVDNSTSDVSLQLDQFNAQKPNIQTENNDNNALQQQQQQSQTVDLLVVQENNNQVQNQEVIENLKPQPEIKVQQPLVDNSVSFSSDQFNVQQHNIQTDNNNNIAPLQQQQQSQAVDLLGLQENSNQAETNNSTANFQQINSLNQQNQNIQNQQPDTNVDNEMQQQQQQQSPMFDPLLDGCQTIKRTKKQIKPLIEDLNMGNYDDDDEIPEQQQQKQQENKEKQNYIIQKGLTLSMKALQNKILLSKTDSRKFPILFSIKTLDSTEENYKVDLEDMNIKERAAIDLIVVVDHSGSMSGEKINLVNQTLKYLLTILTERDRLCLIVFDDRATRLTPLKRNTKENHSFFTKSIDAIFARGGTSICSGINDALRQIQQRKYKNQVTSVFLLSDGLDGGAEQKVAKILQTYNIQDPFTINTFGLGDDHDENLMKGIANLKDGGFYYIQNFSLVDECFVDALGGLISVVGENVKMQAKAESSPPFDDLRVSNHFGLWQFDEQNKIYTQSQNQLLSGISRDYVFEINIPPLKNDLSEEEKSQRVIFRADLSVQEIYGNKETQNFKIELMVDFVGTEEEFKQGNDINKDVMTHYLRVLGAQALEQAKEQAQMQQFEAGQKILQNIIDQIITSGLLEDPTLKLLLEDLERSKEGCQPQQFENYGAKYMTSRIQCHTFQQSSIQPQFKQQYQQFQQDQYDQTISLGKINLQNQSQAQDLLFQQQLQQQQPDFDPYSNTMKKKFIKQLRQQKQ